MKGDAKRWINTIKTAFVDFDIYELIQQMFDTFVGTYRDISFDQLILYSSVFLYVFSWYAYKSLNKKGGI